VTIGELEREAVARLPHREGIPDPSREARWLLARALGRGETWVLAHRDEPAPPPAVELFRGWLVRRAAGEPAHYIVGTCSFWGREFLVSPAVLIPRPETELVVACTQRLDLAARPRVFDVGTGSGCLAVTLALELPNARVVASDVSVGALALARTNARRLAARVAFTAGDLCSHVAERFDLVVANLPYVPAGDIDDLPVEIRNHEPRLALIGGEEGSELLRSFCAELPRLLAPRGFALLEVGAGQRRALAPVLPAFGLVEIERGLDHAGIERVLVMQRQR
jgi:release factor glutamine methyltransferase